MDDKNSNIYALNIPIRHPSYPRVGHKVIELDGQAYIIGGTNQQGSFSKTVFKFNLEKLRIQALLLQNSLGIEGFSLFSYQGLIYIWGGNVEINNDSTAIHPSNTLWCFDGKKFEQCQQSGDIPSKRAFHCSSWFANRYLIVFGGFGKEILNDWYIFDMRDKIWNKMIPLSKLPINTIFQLGWVNGRGIIFSTQLINRQQQNISPLLKNELFELRILDFKTFKFKIDPLAYFECQIPAARSEPNLVFTKNQMIMLGGVKTPKFYSIKNPYQYGEFFNDSWVFNFEDLAWKKNSNTIFNQYGFASLKYRNKIFSFGGIKSTNMDLSSTVEIISLDAQPDKLQQRFCGLCKHIYGLNNNQSLANMSSLTFLDEKQEPSAQISSTFISKIAQLLQNPLYALALLIDNSLNMSASSISIKLTRKSMNFKNNCSKQNSPTPSYFNKPISYIQILDNSSMFHIDEMIRLFHTLKWRVFPTTSDTIYQEQLNLQNEYINNLRLAGLRLAQSCLYVSKNQFGDILVMYFSSNHFDIPQVDKPADCCFYKLQALKKEKQEIFSQYKCSNKIDRNIIKQNLCHLLTEEQFLDVTKYTTKLYLFDVTEIVQVQSKQKGIFSNNSFKSTQNIVCTDLTLSYNMGSGQNISLYDLIKRLYLVPYLGRQIQIQNTKVLFLDLADKFKEDAKNNLIEKINIPENQLVMFKNCTLYRITSLSYSISNIFVYHENRLITSINTKQKSLCGYIQIPKEIEVDIFKSKLAKIQDMRKLLHFIDSKDDDKSSRRKICRNQQQLQHQSKHAGRKLKNVDFYSL